MKDVYKSIASVLLYIGASSSVFAGQFQAWKVTETDIFNFSDVPFAIHQPAASTRNCCAFGYDLSVKFFPPIHINQVIGGEDVTTHKFGNKGKGPSEAQGEMYSCHAGFLDSAHIRHAADWTAYLAITLEKMYRTGGKIKLKREGGKRDLEILPINEVLSKDNIISIAQRISYDTMVWHEILTWYVPAVVPIFSEKHSSFAPEDNFSNIMGTYAAKRALLSGNPYNSAMVEAQQYYLQMYDTRPRQEAIDAFDWVHDIWWNKRLRMPNSWGVMKRHMNSYPAVTPWQVSGREFLGCEIQEAPTLEVPQTVVTPSGNTLNITDLYNLTIKAHKKIPVKELTGNTENIVSHREFPAIVEKMQDIVRDEFMNAGFDDPTEI
jgi:hypothetical protein